MEPINQEMAQNQYLEQVYLQFVKNKNFFYDEVYYKAVSQVAAGAVNVDIELMNLSDLVLKRARELEEDKNIDNWRELSFTLRKIAQEVFNRHGLTDDTRFLKLVS